MADLLLVVKLCEGEIRCEDKENQGRTIIFSTIPLKIVVKYSDTQDWIGIDRPCLAIKIAEFAILRLYFPCIDLGMVSKYILPPLYLVHFLEMKFNR